ncbi:MAG: DUF11 domain-containing protein [Phycisphaerae bacterium]|nr:DUF11 domain-containing protein [Phycisphaerae bacterium]
MHKIVDGKIHSISAYPTGIAATSVLLIERVAPVQATLQEDIEYTVNVTNISENTLYDVTVTEPYSPIFKYRSAVPEPISHQEGTLIWNLGTIAAQEIHTITMRGNAISPGRMSDCVTITYVSHTPGNCIDIEVVNPSIKLTQTGPESVIQCDPIPVTLMVTNDGTGLARNVNIREELPEGLQTSDGQTVIASQAGDLKPGESRTLEVKLKALEAGLYTARAKATAQGNLESYADYTVRVVKPMLVLTTSGPKRRYAGRTAQYDITVTNKGDGRADNLLVTKLIPPGVTYISASDKGVPSHGMVAWNLGSLEPSASKTVSVRVRLDEIGTIVNKVSAKAYCTFVSTESETTVEGIPAILLEVIDLGDPIEVESNETYVIRVTNQGSALGTNIRIVATLPAEMDYVTSSGPTQASVNNKVISFSPLPSLEPKVTAEYRVVIKGVKIGDVRFHVQLESDQMSSPVMETESTHIY